jgi:hypothetical protein
MFICRPLRIKTLLSTLCCTLMLTGLTAHASGIYQLKLTNNTAQTIEVSPLTSTVTFPKDSVPVKVPANTEHTIEFNSHNSAAGINFKNEHHNNCNIVIAIAGPIGVRAAHCSAQSGCLQMNCLASISPTEPKVQVTFH